MRSNEIPAAGHCRRRASSVSSDGPRFRRRRYAVSDHDAGQRPVDPHQDEGDAGTEHRGPEPVEKIAEVQRIRGLADRRIEGPRQQDRAKCNGRPEYDEADGTFQCGPRRRFDEADQEMCHQQRRADGGKGCEHRYRSAGELRLRCKFG